MVLLGFRGALLLHPLMKIYINHGHHTNGIPYLAFASESKRGCWSSLSCREKKKKKKQVFKAGELPKTTKKEDKKKPKNGGRKRMRVNVSCMKKHAHLHTPEKSEKGTAIKSCMIESAL